MAGKGLRFHPVADVVSHSPGLAVRETTLKDGDFPLRPSQSYKLNNCSFNDQAGYVVSGKIRITVDGKSCDLGPGDSYFAPSGALHSALALQESVVVDTFSPPRVDYRAHPVDEGPTIQTIISNEINKNP
ncbi:MAG: cupin domain-containing protein [Methanothrix sp.]